MASYIDGISTDGFEEFASRILKMGEKSHPAIDKALTAGGKILKTAIQRNIPESAIPRSPGGKQTWRSGEHARDHIHQSQPIEREDRQYVLVGISRADSSQWFYLKFYEYGFHRKKEGSWVEVPGLHMFSKAVASTENRILDEMASVLKKELDLD